MSIRNWERENAFRRLSLMGIEITRFSYLREQYRNFREEDGGLAPPLSSIFEDDREKEIIRPDGPVCPVMVITRKKIRQEDEENE